MHAAIIDQTEGWVGNNGCIFTVTHRSCCRIAVMNRRKIKVVDANGHRPYSSLPHCAIASLA